MKDMGDLSSMSFLLTSARIRLYSVTKAAGNGITGDYRMNSPLSDVIAKGVTAVLPDEERTGVNHEKIGNE